MRKEGQVRIPSGCAIAGIFDKSGARMNGEAIIESIAVMHDRSNGLGGGSRPTGSTRNTRTITRSICFTTAPPPARSARIFWIGIST